MLLQSTSRGDYESIGNSPKWRGYESCLEPFWVSPVDQLGLVLRVRSVTFIERQIFSGNVLVVQDLHPFGDLSRSKSR